MEHMLTLIIGLVATVLTTVSVLYGLMKPLFNGLDRRLTNVEADTRMILQHLLGDRSAR